MAIILAEACIDENGQLGYEKHQKGDQTGNEVRFNEYYQFIGGDKSKPWTYVFRCKNTDISNAYTIRMGQAVNNKFFGYGQPSRADVRKKITKSQPDPTKVNEPIDCDCSSLMNTMVAVTFETQNVKTNITGLETTASMPSVYKSSGWFDDVTKQVNLATGEGLKRGDILVRPSSHTACVYSVDKNKTYSNVPKWVAEATRYCNVYASEANNYLASYPYLGQGNKVDVCDESPNRYFVRIAGKYFGFVDKDDLIPVVSTRKGKVTTDLNVRAGAGASFQKVGLFKQGTIVSITTQAKASDGVTWYYASYGNIKGFVSSKYVVLQ